MFLLPLKEARVHAPPGIEMNVLNSADVENVIHKDAAAKRLALNIADEMALVMGGVDAIVRIKELHREHGWIFSAHGNSPGIGLGFISGILVGIINDHAFEGAVVV